MWYSFVENTIHLCIERNIQPNVTAGISSYNVNNLFKIRLHMHIITYRSGHSVKL